LRPARLRATPPVGIRSGGAGSAATAPRPAAAPRHEVRGERRGEEGAVRLRWREGRWGRRRSERERGGVGRSRGSGRQWFKSEGASGVRVTSVGAAFL
jgi:hypothetical protein